MRFKTINSKLYLTFILAIIMISFLLSSPFAYAHSDHPEHGDFEKAEAIINAEIPCEQLNEEDLEMVGDYIMEQMHPGELHEIIDERMGGEGSESLRLAHINIAKVHYCDNYEDYGNNYNMMKNKYYNNINGGMMNMMFWNNIGYGFGWMFIMMLFWIVVIIGVIALIVWLVLTLTNQNNILTNQNSINKKQRKRMKNKKRR